MPTNEKRKVRRDYPLSVLFLLIAIASVMVGFLRPITQSFTMGPVGFAQAAMASAGGAFGVACIGALVGLYHHNRSRGLIFGLATGLAIGSVLGPVALAPVDAAPSLVSIAVGGSVLLVAIAAVFRGTRRRAN